MYRQWRFAAHGKVGLIYKELQFEISGGKPATAYARYLFEHDALTARAQTIHSTDEVTWELLDARGPVEELTQLRELLAQGPLAPALGVEVLHDGPDRIQFIIRWPRPKTGDGTVSLEYLASDLIGPEAILYTLIHGGRAEFKIAAPDGDALKRFFHAAKEALQNRYNVRLLRIGEMRPDWETMPEVKRPNIKTEERKLVAYALGAGYYDNPKRVGVRELGEALGWSKSVVARRLRQIERRALESMLFVQDAEDGLGELRTPAAASAAPVAGARELERVAGGFGEV